MDPTELASEHVVCIKQHEQMYGLSDYISSEIRVIDLKAEK